MLCNAGGDVVIPEVIWRKSHHFLHSLHSWHLHSCCWHLFENAARNPHRRAESEGVATISCYRFNSSHKEQEIPYFLGCHGQVALLTFIDGDH